MFFHFNFQFFKFKIGFYSKMRHVVSPAILLVARHVKNLSINDIGLALHRGWFLVIFTNFVESLEISEKRVFNDMFRGSKTKYRRLIDEFIGKFYFKNTWTSEWYDDMRIKRFKQLQKQQFKCGPTLSKGLKSWEFRTCFDFLNFVQLQVVLRAVKNKWK